MDGTINKQRFRLVINIMHTALTLGIGKYMFAVEHYEFRHC